MGWTTGKDAEAPGKFAYELWSDTEILHRVGGFATPQDADRAGGRANTNWLLHGITEPAVDDIIDNLSDDELLNELLEK